MITIFKAFILGLWAFFIVPLAIAFPDKVKNLDLSAQLSSIREMSAILQAAQEAGVKNLSFVGASAADLFRWTQFTSSLGDKSHSSESDITVPIPDFFQFIGNPKIHDESAAILLPNSRHTLQQIMPQAILLVDGGDLAL
ncbi:MAG: hypothetical protein WCG27_03970, partial [Pseudomonadota bacterium]